MNKGKVARIACICLIMTHFVFSSISNGGVTTDLVSNEPAEKIRSVFHSNPGFDMNKAFQGGETLLMFAAANNPHSAVIHLLVSLGAGINAKDEAGLTPLIYAVTTNKNLGTTFALLQLGADPELADLEGVSALMYAARNADPSIMEALLSKTLDVNKPSIKGWTPLMFAAASNSSTRVAELLLEAGAYINAVDSQGMTPLMLASKCTKNPEMVELLLRYSADTTIKANGETAMDFARRNPKLKSSSALRNLETTTRLRLSEKS
ncbi:MAG: ankyrin repeat domain-containing protein [Synergistaceae bacterium]|nr:ankyrin repeat domain-containing protein [Synergistaceae bacterium]